MEGIDGEYQDARGQGEVTVQVGVEGNGGPYAFGPGKLWVDSGTKVIWEWTGEGGGHNVAHQGGPGDYTSETSAESGFTFEYTFEEGGISEYQCNPHAGLGMKGAVAVGSDVETESVGGGGGGGSSAPSVPNSAKSLGVAATFAMVATLGLGYFFIKYGGDYE
jgi:halocyanin-like protein